MNNISSQDEIKKIILYIEEKWPVEKWEVNGVEIWPYIRIKLYLTLLSNLLKSSNQKETSLKNERFKNKRSFVLKRFFKLLCFFLKLKKKKIFLFGAHFHRVYQDGYHFNRFYDSMISLNSLENDIYVLEYLKVLHPSYNQKAIIELEEVISCYKIFYKPYVFFLHKDKNQLLDYDLFLDFLKEKKIVNLENYEVKSLVNFAVKVNFLGYFFRLVYKISQPKKILYLGYYGYEFLYASIYAAKKENIKTVDFQHGTQMKNLCFSDWTKIPNGGYNIMVDEFWTWDGKSNDNIQKWIKPEYSICAKVVGQPYFVYYKNKILNKDTRPIKKYILYSLHLDNLDDLLNDTILNFIKKHQYNWVFRLHPRSSQEFIEELKNKIAFNQIISKVTIQDSLEIPLPESLLNCDLNVTNFSGTVIEALILNIPSVIIDKRGFEIYNEYFDNKLVCFTDKNSENFEFDMNEIINKNFVNSYDFKELKIINPLDF